MNSPLISKFKGPRVVISTTVSTSPYTIDGDSPEALSVDATAGVMAIALPLISGYEGRSYTIRKIDSSSNAVTVTAAGSDFIEGSTSISLINQWQCVTLDNDGVKWHQTGTNGNPTIAGTALGEVVFVNASLQPTGNTLFRWDNVNGRLGIGIATPTTALQVVGTIFSSSGGFKFPDNTTQTTAATATGSNTGDVTQGTFGTTPSTFGYSLTGQVLSGQPADGTHPGFISLLPQTMGAGLKTFSNGIASTSGDFTGVVTMTPTNGVGHIQTANTRAIWRLDESSGTSTVAEVTSVFPLATVTGTPTAVTGIFSRGRNFAGTSKIQGSADAASVTKAKAGSYSVGFWIKINSTGSAKDVLTLGNGSTNGVFYINLGFGFLNVGNTDVGNTHVGSTLTNGVWYHAVFVHEPASSGFRYYQNGVSQGVVTVALSGLTVATPKWTICGGTALGGADVVLDDIWWEDTSMSGAEVLADYNLAITNGLIVDTNTLVVDAFNHRVGIGTANPSVTLDVVGATAISSNLAVDTNTLFVDATNNRVGIGTATPSFPLHYQQLVAAQTDLVFENTSTTSDTGVNLTIRGSQTTATNRNTRAALFLTGGHPTIGNSNDSDTASSINWAVQNSALSPTSQTFKLGMRPSQSALMLFSDSITTGTATGGIMTWLRNGNVGIGVAAPSFTLEVKGTGIRSSSEAGGIMLDSRSYSATAANSSYFRLLRGRGTVASPATVTTSDILSDIVTSGYWSTSSAAAGAKVSVVADGVWSTTNAPAYIAFYTQTTGLTQDGSDKTVERLRIKANGETASQVASGSIAFSQLQGAKHVTNGATATRWISDDGTNITLTGPVLATGTLSASNLSGTNTGDVTIGTANGLSLAGQVLSLSLSTAAVATTAAVTLYVATTGNDSNPGTIGSPFLTIQAAIDSLPKNILHPVDISIGSGNFAGFALRNFNITQPANVANGAYLNITGTRTTATVATGTATGTATAGSAGSGTTYGTLTDSGQSWTVNDLRGKMVEITSSTGIGQLNVISSNTATTITIAGTWTSPVAGSTYTIRDWGTVINSNTTIPGNLVGLLTSSVTSILSTTSPITAIAISDIYGSIRNGGAMVAVQQMKVTSGGIQVLGSVLALIRQCNVSLGSGVFAIQGFRGAALHVMTSYISSSGSSYNIGTGNTADPGGFVEVKNSFISGGAVGVESLGFCNLIGTMFLGQTTASVLVGPSTIQAQGLRIDGNGAGGAGIGTEVTTAGHAPSSFWVITGDISNCATGISLASGGAIGTISTVSGTGNTTAISLSLGAGLQIGSGSTLTGTTEISIDGTTSTLATMRAASPKVISNINYGTRIFE